MTKEMMYQIITKMHIRLNRIIEDCNYDLMRTEVQSYSRRLDKVISHYNRLFGESKYSLHHEDTDCDYKQGKIKEVI